MVLITEDESLISTNIAKQLFTKKEITDGIFLKEIKDDFYLCISKCEKNVRKILNNIPKDWNLDVHNMENLLKSHLFNNIWSADCFEHFLKLLQLQFSS